jgi:hypothetical protein
MGGAALEPAGLGSEGIPGAADGVEDAPIVPQHAVREEALAQVEPDSLDRVELRAVGRQVQEREVGWHLELLGTMPAGLVQDENSVDAGLELLSERLQEQADCLGIGVG